MPRGDCSQPTGPASRHDRDAASFKPMNFPSGQMSRRFPGARAEFLNWKNTWLAQARHFPPDSDSVALRSIRRQDLLQLRQIDRLHQVARKADRLGLLDVGLLAIS